MRFPSVIRGSDSRYLLQNLINFFIYGCLFNGGIVKKESKVATFIFKKVDEDLIIELSEYLDNQADRIWNFFELKFDKKVIIKIVPTKKEYDDCFRKTHNMSKDAVVEGWSIGNCRNGIITYLSLKDYKNTTHAYKDADFCDALEYYKKTIVHEYVHFVNERFNEIHNCNYTEKYLVEGIATYLSRQKEGQKISFDFNCEQLLDKNNNFYNAYYLVTKYFVEHYNKEYVLEIFQSNRQARELLRNELFEKAKEFIKNEIEKQDFY